MIMSDLKKFTVAEKPEFMQPERGRGRLNDLFAYLSNIGPTKCMYAEPRELGYVSFSTMKANLKMAAKARGLQITVTKDMNNRVCLFLKK